MGTQTPLKVVCIDDEPSILRLLLLASEDEPDVDIVATTTTRREFHNLVEQHRPDVLVIDLGLRGSPQEPGRSDGRQLLELGSGLQLIEAARSVVPDATIAVFTGRDGFDVASRSAGADVYVEKPHVHELWPAIRQSRAAR